MAIIIQKNEMSLETLDNDKRSQLNGQSKKKNVSWSSTIVTSVKILPRVANSADVSNNDKATHKINNKRQSSSSSTTTYYDTATQQCSLQQKKGEEKWVPKYLYKSLEDNQNGRYTV